MSWETRGRQYHAWFGHGTADADGEPHELSAAEIASIVAAGAAASLSGGEKAGFQQYLSNGGLKALSEAIPIWAAGSGLGGGRISTVYGWRWLAGDRARDAATENSLSQWMQCCRNWCDARLGQFGVMQGSEHE